MSQVWFGPADHEWIGDDSDGTPVVANDEGVARMTDGTAYFDLAEFLPHESPTEPD